MTNKIHVFFKHVRLGQEFTLTAGEALIPAQSLIKIAHDLANDKNPKAHNMSDYDHCWLMPKYPLGMTLRVRAFPDVELLVQYIYHNDTTLRYQLVRTDNALSFCTADEEEITREMLTHPAFIPDPNAAALYAAFFMEGLRDNDYNALLEHWDKGCLELIQELVREVPFLLDLDLIPRNHTHGVGIFEYEVCSTYGKWFGEQVFASPTTDGPTSEACKAKLTELVEAFYAQH